MKYAHSTMNCQIGARYLLTAGLVLATNLTLAEDLAVNAILPKPPNILPIQNFPKTLVKYVIAVEDPTFYHRPGNTSASPAKNSNRTMPGTSSQSKHTISHQVAKNLIIASHQYDYKKSNTMRKQMTQALSILLEKKNSKDEILEYFMNHVAIGYRTSEDYRGTVFGFPAGADFYFNKKLDELNISEYALLVGLIRGFAYYNPWIHPEKALKRRQEVLVILHSKKLITKKQFRNALNAPLTITTK